MKPCPFCAEEIQDAAIKCRFCGSFLSAAPAAAGGDSGDGGDAGQWRPHRQRPLHPAVPAAGAQTPARELLYAGSPSWLAYLRYYVVSVATAAGGPFLGYYLADSLQAPARVRLWATVGPVGLGLLMFVATHLARRAKRMRVTTTNIETESGILSRKIDVVELWRCRDIRYRQSLLDRILRIAHIDIYTVDVTTPDLTVVGMPASRQLFERLRDSIEFQRQGRQVIGVVR